jgi:hypothetical protein
MKKAWIAVLVFLFVVGITVPSYAQFRAGMFPARGPVVSATNNSITIKDEKSGGALVTFAGSNLLQYPVGKKVLIMYTKKNGVNAVYSIKFSRR